MNIQNDVIAYLQVHAQLLVRTPSPHPDLWQGTLGQALVSLYVANALGDEALFEQGFGYLSTCIEAIYAGQYPATINATIAHGLTGLGFVLHSLIEDGLIENDLTSLLTDLDSFVYQGTRKYLQQSNFDYWRGGLGGLYFLCQRTQKRPELRDKVTQLVKIALKIKQIPLETGVVWLRIHDMSIARHKTEKIILQIASSLTATDAKTSYFLQQVSKLFPNQSESLFLPNPNQEFQKERLVSGLEEQCLYCQRLYALTGSAIYQNTYQAGIKALISSSPSSQIGFMKSLKGTLLLLAAYLHPKAVQWQQML
ncbi:MAG: hypothetical protein ACK4GN_14420 [Runella sp.]